MDDGLTRTQILGRALVYAVVTAVLLLAVGIALSLPSQRERRETNANVRLLVEETQLNRELVCLAVLRNANNPARDDPRVMEICAEIGVVV